MRNAVSLAAVALLAASAGFGETRTGSPAVDHQRPAAAKAAAKDPGKSDAAIEKTIRTKLEKSKIGADHFTVHVRGGIATWDGHTDVVQHKGAATRMARTAGAARVINNIQISDAARAKAAGNLETGRRRAQLKRGDARSQ